MIFVNVARLYDFLLLCLQEVFQIYCRVNFSFDKEMSLFIITMFVWYLQRYLFCRISPLRPRYDTNEINNQMNRFWDTWIWATAQRYHTFFVVKISWLIIGLFDTFHVRITIQLNIILHLTNHTSSITLNPFHHHTPIRLTRCNKLSNHSISNLKRFKLLFARY